MSDSVKTYLLRSFYKRALGCAGGFIVCIVCLLLFSKNLK